MEILQSWQDENGTMYAIVEHSHVIQKQYGCKRLEAMWLDEDRELWNFGGSPGMKLADFDSLEEAEGFLMDGIAGQRENPDVWFEMVAI